MRPLSGATARVGASELPAPDAIMAQARDENFPVASRLLGRRYRRHLLAIYGFARLVDDTGDEARGDRRLLLDLVEADVRRIYEGHEPQHPVLRTLRRTIEECRLPEHPFARLIEANRRDQEVTRYETFDALLDYCQLSAAPVGELVLHIFDAATPSRIKQSDRVCAGLQVIEHLQDVAEDYSRGRVYLPQEDLAGAGCREVDLRLPAATPALRGVIARLADRSRVLLEAGLPLTSGLSGRPRLAVAGFVAGGRATLGSVARAGYDVLEHRPRRSRRDFAVALYEVLRGR